VGNIWYYEDPDSITSSWDILTISDSIQINGQKYFLWSRGPGAEVSDTICYDSNHNVLRCINDETHLWFDFMQDSGAVYAYAPPDADFGEEQYAYQVHVYRNITVETPLKTFSNCIQFLFDIPQVIDEEHTYIFAPDVGLVLEQSNGWWTNTLHDYHLGDTPTAVNGRETIINDFHLHQNYPNPFNSSTSIHFYLPSESHVQLTVFDALGRTVDVLLNKKMLKGYHKVPFHSLDLSSGLYFYRLITDFSSETKKLIVQK